MRETNDYKKGFYIVLVAFIALFFASMCGSYIQKSRLDEYRQQLESVRKELAAANNRQSELTNTIAECGDIIRRDGEILSESATTIQGLRSQICVVRKSYEEMEVLLFGATSNSSNGNDITNYKIGETNASN